MGALRIPIEALWSVAVGRRICDLNEIFLEQIPMRTNWTAERGQSRTSPGQSCTQCTNQVRSEKVTTWIK